MTQRFCLLGIALLAACGSAPDEGPVRFPEALQSEWRLGSEQAIALEAIPELVQTLGIREARKVIYQGPEPLTVVV